ncbi:hypothetical protein SDC9_89593 [bioreactor metagenome]|uniref:Uncharacterized protein n=1 Tax=bioreactor metagenome TaxID=1076179 RepID=A0A644ZSQ3_9ZZZZ
MELSALNDQPRPAGIGDTHAHARVLHGAADAHIFCGVIIGLHRLQRLRKPRGRVHDLAVGQFLSRSDGIAPADLPGGDSHLIRHLAQKAFHAKAGLRDSEAPKRPGGGIVGVIRPPVDLKILIVVRPRRMGTGPLQHRPSQRRIGSGIRNDLRRHALNDAVFIAAHGKLHLHGMPLGVDEDALGSAELCLDRTLCEIRHQRSQMLHGHVLLAAEAAAHQQVFDLHLFSGQAQHPHGLVLRVICPLVRGPDHHAVLLRERHGALRLQKRVLCPGCGKVLRQHIFRSRNGLRWIAPLDMLVGQKISRPVDQRRIRQHGLLWAADHGQFLVVHLHEGLRLFQELLRLSGHNTDGVTQIMRDLPHRDHGVPVLHQVPHLVLSGDIRRRKHAHNTRQGFRLLRVDGQHPRPGIGAAHRAGVNHSVQIDIVRILPRTSDLFQYVHPRDPRAQTPILRQLRNFSVAEHLRRQQNSVDDLYVPGTAADVVADGKRRLFSGGIPVHIQQRLGGDHHARNTKPALHGPRLAERIGKHVLLKIAQALHRQNGLSLQLVGLGDAGLRGLSVDQHRAGAAGSLAAPVLHGSQPQFIPQEADEFLVFLHGHSVAVHGKCRHRVILLKLRARPRSHGLFRVPSHSFQKGRPFLSLYNNF